MVIMEHKQQMDGWCVCGAIAQLVRESSYGVSTSVTLQGCKSSHSNGELWHNFLVQETHAHLPLLTQEYK